MSEIEDAEIETIEDAEVEEVIPRTGVKGTAEKKYHVDLSCDPQILAIKEKTKDLPVKAIDEKVNEEDIKRILQRYATDERLDLYTIAEAFSVSESTLARILKSDKYKDLYHACKLKRGEHFVQLGFEVASTPFDKIQNGEEVSMVEVASAKLKAHYALSYGQSLNTQFNPQKDKTAEGGGINVVVNTGIQIDL